MKTKGSTEDDDETSSEKSTDTFEEEADMEDTPVKECEIRENDFVCDLICRLMSGKIIDDPMTSTDCEEETPSEKKKAETKKRVKTVDIKLSYSDVVTMCELARSSLLKQPSLLRIKADKLPLTICGDIHGNFIHLRNIFLQNGSPALRTYLFLGDYVDRGVQGLEAFMLLVALQYRYPTKVHLLRGNHEDSNTTLSYGYYDECKTKFGLPEADMIWSTSMDIFNCLPVAAIVNEAIMCMHGGLSPFMNSLEDIEKIVRPCIVPPYGIVCDLVWSDPQDKYACWAMSHRGISFTFGEPIVRNFCQKIGVDLIIRGHQIVHDMYRCGYKPFGNGRLFTIFSSLNYINNRNNACVTNVSKEMRIQFMVFRCRKYALKKPKSKAADSDKDDTSDKSC